MLHSVAKASLFQNVSKPYMDEKFLSGKYCVYHQYKSFYTKPYMASKTVILQMQANYVKYSLRPKINVTDFV